MLRTPRPATEPRDGPTRNFHEKYRKNTPRAEILEPQENTPKYRKNTKNAHFWYFGGIFSVFSKFRESRISGRGVFFRYFSWKFRVGPFRGSVAGRGVLNLCAFSAPWHFVGRLIFVHLQCWEALPFARIQRQRCIKFRVLRAQEFYTPLALNSQKGQCLPALEVYKNQSPICWSRSRAKLYTPPSLPPPISGYKAFFRGGGVGVYILRPPAPGILYAPPFYTPPTPRRVFSGEGLENPNLLK